MLRLLRKIMKSKQALSIRIPVLDVFHHQTNRSKQPVLTESVALAAQPKQYALDSDSVSKESKALHLNVYKRACESFTRLSAEVASAIGRNDFQNLAKTKRDLVAARNSVFLHELFFSNCFCRNSQLSISSISYARLARDFGDFNDWQRDFFSRAEEIRASSGWIVTAYDMFLRRFVNLTVCDDTSDIPIGCWPVIVVDCFEHAYVRDHNIDVTEHLSKMMSEFNWDVINERVVKADALAEGLK